MTTNDPYAGDYTLAEARTASVDATKEKIKSLVGEISDEFDRGLEQVRQGIAPGYDTNNRMPGALRVAALERIVANLRLSGLTVFISGNAASTASPAPSALGPAARRGQQLSIGTADTQRLQNELTTAKDQLNTQAGFIEGMLTRLGLGDFPWEDMNDQQEILDRLTDIFQRSQQRSAPPQRRFGNQHLGSLDPQDPPTTQLPPVRRPAPSPADGATQAYDLIERSALANILNGIDEALGFNENGEAPPSSLGVLHPRKLGGALPSVDPDDKKKRETGVKAKLRELRELANPSGNRRPLGR